MAQKNKNKNENKNENRKRKRRKSKKRKKKEILRRKGCIKQFEINFNATRACM